MIRAKKLVTIDNCCNFKGLKIKRLQIITAMFTEDNVTEIFYIADEFCKFYDRMLDR